MKRPARERARVIAKARRGDESARGPLVEMLGAEKQSFWRAVAAAVLGQWAATPEVRGALTAALDHADPLVREQAAGALTPLAQGEGAMAEVKAAVGRRLVDPARAVRMRAAWALHAALDPDSPPGRELLAQLAYGADQPLGASLMAAYKLEHKDVDGAVAYATKAANWNPNVAGQRDVLGSALILQGHTQAAADQFAIAMRLDPREVRYPMMLALAYDRLGRFEDAVRTLRQAEAAHPRDAELPYTRAAILLKLNQREAAREAARRAVELNPNYREAQALLRDLR
jgi:tetratricopeptide (TPR) repeat protein